MLFAFLLLFSTGIQAQRQTENIIIITTDGFRWQEVFKGMDSVIANNPKYNQGDSEYLYKNFWGSTENERRKKLLPFLWSTVVTKGQIFEIEPWEVRLTTLILTGSAIPAIVKYLPAMPIPILTATVIPPIQI